MVTYRTIVALFVALSAQAQPFTVGELVNDSASTNGGGSGVVHFAPVAFTNWVLLPAPNGIAQTNILASDPNGIVLSYFGDSSHTKGNINGQMFNTLYPFTVGSPFYLYNFVFGSLNISGDSDTFQWFATNSFKGVTTETDFLWYPTNLPSSYCGYKIPYKTIQFQFPDLTGVSYFFSIYSTGNFSNLWYYNSSVQRWAKITTTTQFPTTFDNTYGWIDFSNLVSYIPCASLSISNSPCKIVAPTNMNLIVLTNSIDTFQLAGNVPTFVISTQPTNGYLTNLNGNSGLVTYVETNNAASLDYFQYCTSNSISCMKCADVYIAIADGLTCLGGSSGQSCFGLSTISLVNPLQTFGHLDINTGIPDETVCVLYTNASCVAATNCQITDSYGDASFWLPLCSPNSTNVCIASLLICSNVCYFSHVLVFGSGSPNCFGTGVNGDYYVSSVSYTPTAGLDVILTNSSSPGDIFFEYVNPPALLDPNITNSQYGGIFDINGCQQAVFVHRVFDDNCRPLTDGSITGWILDPSGTLPLPNANISGIINLTNICIQICP